MGTNTGDGGFTIDGKTYTYDVGDPKDQGPEPPVADDGDVSVDNSKKDLNKRTKETIGKYLSNLTQGNTYGIDPNSTEITTSDPGVSETGNSEKFVARDLISFPNDIGEHQRNGVRLFDKVDDPNAKLAISKGRATPQLDNGHVVLPSVQGGLPGTFPSSIQPYVSTVLANNRFTAASPMIAGNPSDPNRTYDPSFTHPKYGNVSSHRLAQVGVALSIRASQELGATAALSDPSSGGQEAKALLPGFNQIGAERINTRLLEARDVLETLTTSEVPEGNQISIAPGGSWGSLNNVHDPYSGITAIGMIALSAALTAAIVVLFEGLGFLLSLIKGGDKTGATKNPDGRYALGRYNLVQGPDPNAFPPTSFPPDIGAMLGIRPTVHPFSAALQAGVAAFFGIDTSNGILGQVTSGLTSATENPGFNSIVARSIIRSTLSIIDSFKDAFKSPNLIAGVKNVLSIVDTIRSSKLISSMNVFASLGDHVMIADLLGERVDDGIPGEPMRTSRIDKLEDTAPAVQKNRLKGKLKLAWSSNRSPSSYLIPDPLMTFAALGGKFGAFQTVPGLSTPLARNYYKVLSLTEQTKTALRLPYDSADPTDVTVKSMEGQLDAEYMPFYFHDLRTNEIISFHAFITQISDDYTVGWEQSDGYGRIDPVKIYKNTTRRINVGFYIASTSDEDFNDMWVKINKLVTMVYPQFTQGRLLSDAEGNNQFTQPFSQLIGASPLIRLRLGDIFRSNYSRFALARLFGADSNVMKLDGTSLEFANGVDSFQKLKTAVAADLKNPTGKRFLLMSTNLSKPSEAGSVSISLPAVPGTQSGAAPVIAPSFNVPPGDANYFMFKVAKEQKGDQVVVVPEMMSIKMMQDFFGLSPEAGTNVIKHLSAEYANEDKPMKNVVGGQYVASKNDLMIAPDRLNKLMEESFGKEANEAIEKLSKFLNPEKNALVKSFRETQGKGLAGTIDSINFDYNQVTWEIAPGRRAPQYLKVTIAFSPIHDIPPGLDHLGFNRAPVYPVGHLGHGPDNGKEGT
jgi:hypothetical protein